MFIAFDYTTNFYLELDLIYRLLELLSSSRHLISVINVHRYKLAVTFPTTVTLVNHLKSVSKKLTVKKV